jgi:O-antigen/teichoic acid export membrane protein
MGQPDRIGPRARRLVRNVVTGGGSQAGVLLVSLAVTPVLVAGLGMSRYGLWALAGVLVNYLGLLDLGVGTAFVRFLAFHHARDDGRRYNSVVRLGLFFYALFAALTLPAVIAARRPLLEALRVAPDMLAEASFLLIGVTVIFLLRSQFVVYRAAVSAVERIDVNNRIALYVALPSGAGAILVVWLGFGLRGLVLNGLATALVTVVAQTIAAYRLVPMLRLRPLTVDWSVAPELLRYGFRVQATRLAELLNGHIDKLVLGFLIGTVSVGLYDLGLKLSLLAAALPTLILPAVLPTTSLLEAKGDRELLESLHRRASKYVGLILAPAAMFTLVATPSILRFWIGQGGLEESVVAARLLIVGAVPLLALGVSRLVARGIGLPQMEMRASMVMAGANLLLSIGLVRWIGAVGAPLGSACAGLLGGGVFLALFRRGISNRFDLDPVRPIARPFLAAGLASAGALAGLCLARWLEVPGGRVGALAELVLAGVPFCAVYLAAVLRSSLLDEYDHRVARETWALASAPFRTGASR